MKKWDDIIKAALDAQNKPYDSDWAGMQAQLEKEMGPLSQDDLEWDEAMKASLASRRTPGTPDWGAFSALANAQKARRRKVLVSKSIELLGLLFLILIGYSYTQSHMQKTTQNQYAEANSAALTDHENVQGLEERPASASTFTQKSEQTNPATSETGEPAALRLSTNEGPQTLIEDTPAPITTKQEKTGSEKRMAESSELKKSRPISEVDDSPTPQMDKAPALQSIDAVPTLGLLDLDRAPTELSLAAPIWLAEQKIDPIATTDRSGALQVYFGGSLNYIITPSNEEFNFGSYDHSSYSAQFGIAYRFQLGHKWQLRTAVEYTRLNYDSRNIAQIVDLEPDAGPLVVYQPRNIQMDILTVPLDLRYVYSQYQSRKLYVMGGLAAGFVVGSSYDFSSYEILRLMGETTINPADNPSEVPQEFVRRGLRENSFIAGRLGIGITEEISSSISYFMEPHVQLHFGQGIGPSWDRVHRFGMNVGLEYRW